MTATFTPDHAGVGRMLRADFMQRAMLSHAEDIKHIAEAIAPTGDLREDPHAGRYRASFHTRVHSRGGATRDRAEAVVYNDSPDAFWVEFGHRGREPYNTLRIAAFRRI
jgi:hypothetical protein